MIKLYKVIWHFRNAEVWGYFLCIFVPGLKKICVDHVVRSLQNGEIRLQHILINDVTNEICKILEIISTTWCHVVDVGAKMWIDPGHNQQYAYFILIKVILILLNII